MSCSSDDGNDPVDPPNPPVNNECDSSLPLFDDLTGNALLQKLKSCYTPERRFEYREAREIMYTDVDVFDGKINAIYSGYEVELDYDGHSSAISAASAADINTEHIFPRSQGAENFPALSDMHSIIPARDVVNSARLNYRFDEIPDNATDTWFFNTTSSSSTPTSNIDEWSELDESSSGGRWEPREIRKGDIARAVFYFVVIHNDVANASYFNQMRDVLLQWHEDDPVDQRESTRNARVKSYQGNDNPFIVDDTLAGRLFN